MKRIKQNFIRTTPVLVGYLFLGIGFGILLRSKGYGVTWAAAMAVSTVSGSMQYIACDLLATSASVLSCALTTVLVNIRYIFYSLSLLDKYKDTGKYKPYLIFGITDETYSIICSTPNLTNLDRFLVTLFDHCYWIVGCIIGSVLGTFIPTSFKGLDFSLTALFVSILIDQCTQKENRIPAAVGLLVTLICMFVFGKANFLLASVISITVILLIIRMVKKGEKK